MDHAEGFYLGDLSLGRLHAVLIMSCITGMKA